MLKKMDEQFYSTLNHDSEMQPQNEEVQPESNGLSDSDMELLQLLKITYARDESNAFETISFKVIFSKVLANLQKSADIFQIKKSVSKLFYSNSHKKYRITNSENQKKLQNIN